MSPRRFDTVSPRTGWPSKALPVADQSFSVPVSNPRLSGWPSLPLGIIPSRSEALTQTSAEQAANNWKQRQTFFIAMKQVGCCDSPENSARAPEKRTQAFHDAQAQR